uniref:NADH-ubiquinone oxidoreductase chain 1 n=1 Tax=Laternula truncata TaxID=1199070 RepID=A0A1U9XPL3_9BIVA|nr:NADH dehydrogenase subunit 1 [Laternula truncata]AQZ26188.1 NADH dehydrogenase subunit 1 [Laternula truncata]
MSYKLVCVIITYICVLLAVAFFTLFERKILGYAQLRKGPNKVGVVGLLQPFSDALKLLSKEYAVLLECNQLCFFLAPALSFFLAMMMWNIFPSFNGISYFVFGVIYFLCVSSVSVYGVLLAGWSSNSKYALIGAIRGAAQTISYEVSFSLLLLFCVFLTSTFDLEEFYFPIALLGFPLFLMFVASMLAETNRAPFDLVEGESELVSGFNVEYSGPGFTLIFLAEYANIIFISTFTSMIWLGGFSFWFISGPSVLVFKSLLLSFFFVWARGALPRYRYDLLMSLAWKSFLPAALVGLCLALLMFSYYL